jgi:ferritin-like protein
VCAITPLSQLQLMNSLQRDFKAFKVQFMINALFSNTADICRLYNFKTVMTIVLKKTDLDDFLNAAFEKLELELEELLIKGSGFIVSQFIDFCAYVNKYEPPSAGKYFPLPKKIADKKAIISVRNTDECCFKYAMLSKFIKKNAQQFKPRVYKKLENKYDWTDVNFPADFKDIKIFLRNTQGKTNLPLPRCWCAANTLLLHSSTFYIKCIGATGRDE